jgi:hypothetical protein
VVDLLVGEPTDALPQASVVTLGQLVVARPVDEMSTN